MEAIVLFPSDSSYSESDKVRGFIKFYQTNSCYVTVHVNLEGLPPGIHGFHIHEYAIKQEFINRLKSGEKIKNLCATLGGHFNPFKTLHGSNETQEKHAGDLINNLPVSSNGKVNIIFNDSLISLQSSKLNCILNKSIVIHDEPDDEGIPGWNSLLRNIKLNKREEESLKTGNAGKRIACGNINLKLYS